MIRKRAMNPVRQEAIIGLLEWVRHFRPAVRSLASLTKDRFMSLVKEYEAAKGAATAKKPDAELWLRWEETHVWLSKHPSDKEAREKYPK
jgi:hypothetical protein